MRSLGHTLSGESFTDGGRTGGRGRERDEVCSLKFLVPIWDET